MEPLPRSHLVNGGVEGRLADLRKGFSHITDAHLDDGFVRICLGEAGHPLGDVAEKVRSLQFQVIVIDVCHGG